MASKGFDIKRLHDGRWEARYRDATGSQRRRRFDLKGEAEAHLAIEKVKRLKGEVDDPKVKRITVEQWVEQYQATRKSKAQGTRNRENSILTVHIVPSLGSLRLSDVKPAHINEWVEEQEAKNLQPSTVARHYAVLRHVFNRAANHDLIPKSPCRGIELTKGDDHPEMRFLSTEEVEALASAIDPRYRALVFVGAYAGLRIGELAGLRAERIKFLQKEIHIVEGYTESTGKIGELKTPGSRGKVPIPNFLAEKLAVHLEQYPLGPEGQVFTNSSGGQLRPTNFRDRQWDPAVAASVGNPCKPHSLRHSYVAYLIGEGFSSYIVSRLARHADEAFTTRVYGHLFQETHDKVAQALELRRLRRMEGATYVDEDKRVM